MVDKNLKFRVLLEISIINEEEHRCYFPQYFENGEWVPISHADRSRTLNGKLGPLYQVQFSTARDAYDFIDFLRQDIGSDTASKIFPLVVEQR